MSRDDLHRLVDQIPDSELSAAQRYLEFLKNADPIRRALDAAPVDDEGESDDERAAVVEGEDDISAGRTLTTDELKRELGL